MYYLVTETAQYERYYVVGAESPEKAKSLVDSASSFELPGGHVLVGKLNYVVTTIDESEPQMGAIRTAIQCLQIPFEEPKEIKAKKKKPRPIQAEVPLASEDSSSSSEDWEKLSKLVE